MRCAWEDRMTHSTKPERQSIFKLIRPRRLIPLLISAGLFAIGFSFGTSFTLIKDISSKTTKFYTNQVDTSNFPFPPYDGIVRHKPFLGNVYDLSFVAYDKDFAKEFGLDPKFIAPMDKGMRWMEFQIRTEGEDTYCYFKFFIDKSLETALPSENYDIEGNTNMNLPSDPNDHINLSAELRKLENWDLDRDSISLSYLAIGNPGYKFNKTGRPITGGKIGLLSLDRYRVDKTVPYNYIFSRAKCNSFREAKYPDPSIWIRKKGGKFNHMLPHIEEYLVFRIPDIIVKPFYRYSSLYYDHYRSQGYRQFMEEEKKRGIKHPVFIGF